MTFEHCYPSVVPIGSQGFYNLPSFELQISFSVEILCAALFFIFFVREMFKVHAWSQIENISLLSFTIRSEKVGG